MQVCVCVYALIRYILIFMKFRELVYAACIYVFRVRANMVIASRRPFAPAVLFILVCVYIWRLRTYTHAARYFACYSYECVSAVKRPCGMLEV